MCALQYTPDSFRDAVRFYSYDIVSEIDRATVRVVGDEDYATGGGECQSLGG